MKRELKRIEVGLPFLATVGSASPFVGLFGTVWGIMHSFTAIAQAKDTSLAVVAPGIAEALFATALGLAAAIPAVVAYNQITVSLGRSADKASPASPRWPRPSPAARARDGAPRRSRLDGDRSSGTAGPATTETATRLRPMAEINVTPIVDVMLVLLIIFMVAAPLMVQGVPLDLPQDVGDQAEAKVRKPMVVSLAPDGALYIRDEQVDATMLVKRLWRCVAEGDSVVYVRADRKIPMAR